MEREKTVEAFHDYLIGRGFSSLTCDLYVRNINAFLNSGHELTAEGAEKYLRSLNNSKNTLQTKFYILRSFLKFAGYSGGFPKPPKGSKKLPRFLTEREAKKMVKTAYQIGDVKSLMILSFLLYTGVRVSELTNIHIEDISFENSAVKVHGKGDKERIVPIPKKFLKALKQYIGKRKSGVLFLTKYGQQYSRHGIYAVVKKYARLAGIRKNVSPHILRHTFATLALSNGTDPFTIKEILGHNSINTTLKYAHVMTSGMAKAVEGVANLVDIGREGDVKTDGRENKEI